MRIAVVGTGIVGQTLAGKLAELGHNVTVGTRDITATTTRTDPDITGNPPYLTWADGHPQVALGTFAEAVAQAELVINASSGSASLPALHAAGRENLAGKVLIDVANPLDFSQGMPPTLLVSDTDSLAEQIQRAFPDTKVVKTLNTVNARVMANPGELGGGDHTIFVSGDDAQAKRTVTDLLVSFGFTDIIDLGDISTARGPEMMMPMWLRLMTALGTPMLNYKIIRQPARIQQA